MHLLNIYHDHEALALFCKLIIHYQLHRRLRILYIKSAFEWLNTVECETESETQSAATFTVVTGCDVLLFLVYYRHVRQYSITVKNNLGSRDVWRLIDVLHCTSIVLQWKITSAGSRDVLQYTVYYKQDRLMPWWL